MVFSGFCEGDVPVTAVSEWKSIGEDSRVIDTDILRGANKLMAPNARLARVLAS
jgi:hypothetical protein